MVIVFTKHSRDKFDVLKEHGVRVTEPGVIAAITNPDIIDRTSRKPLLVFQARLDKSHVLRVICKKEHNTLKVITFYPGRTKQYAK
jgi:hypothetical protein